MQCTDGHSPFCLDDVIQYRRLACTCHIFSLAHRYSFIILLAFPSFFLSFFLFFFYSPPDAMIPMHLRANDRRPTPLLAMQAIKREVKNNTSSAKKPGRHSLPRCMSLSFFVLCHEWRRHAGRSYRRPLVGFWVEWVVLLLSNASKWIAIVQKDPSGRYRCSNFSQCTV